MSVAVLVTRAMGALGLLLVAACVLLGWCAWLLTRLVDLGERNRRDGLAAALDIYRQLEALTDIDRARSGRPAGELVPAPPPAPDAAHPDRAAENLIAWLDRKALEVQGLERPPGRDVPL